MQAEERIEEIVDSSRHTVFNWNEIWRYRELFIFFAWRDIKIKYKQTVLGFLWAVLQPLTMMVIFTFFFGRALRVPSQGLPYPVFVLSGLLLWTAFSTGLTNAANSMISNSAIVKKIYFPRLIMPVSSVIVAFFDLLMAFLVFIPILVFYRQPVLWSALWIWPVAIAVCLIATLGPGSWLAALNVKYRDFRYVIPFLVQVLFFFTPIIYPSTMLPESSLRYAAAVSPMYAAIELFRYPLTGGNVDMNMILISLGSGIFFLLAGILYFKRAEEFFADFA
ncbi:MAG TPA: ABC transporter permease [Cyclobacteriaceae bacterium]|nr:ABC transporter permease [Cyclobacteriaceae bacterium]